MYKQLHKLAPRNQEAFIALVTMAIAPFALSVQATPMYLAIRTISGVGTENVLSRVLLFQVEYFNSLLLGALGLAYIAAKLLESIPSRKPNS